MYIFYFIKVGCEGVKITRVYFHDGTGFLSRPMRRIRAYPGRLGLCVGVSLVVAYIHKEKNKEHFLL